MAKRQTRRSISVKGVTYQRLKNWCDANGKTCSGALEEMIKEKLDGEGVPEEIVLHERVPEDADTTADSWWSGRRHG